MDAIALIIIVWIVIAVPISLFLGAFLALPGQHQEEQEPQHSSTPRRELPPLDDEQAA